MSKVKITSDSISDLDYLFAERGIARLPIPILLGDREGLDGEITPDDIYAFFDETKSTPKTSAITPEKYYEFFKEQTAGGSECGGGATGFRAGGARARRLRAELGVDD